MCTIQTDNFIQGAARLTAISIFVKKHKSFVGTEDFALVYILIRKKTSLFDYILTHFD